MDTTELKLAGMDVAELLDRVMQKQELVRIFVKKFLEIKTYDELTAAIAAGDMKAAEFACHSLKGMCGNLSLKTLFQLFQQQLTLFRAGDAAGAVAMMDTISAQYSDAVEHLRLWLAQQ